VTVTPTTTSTTSSTASASGPPAMPTGVTVTSHRTSMDVSYAQNPASDHITQYNLYRDGSPPPWAEIGQPWTCFEVAAAAPGCGSPSQTPDFANHVDVLTGESYCYRISAVNAYGEGPKTGPFCGIADHRHHGRPSVSRGLGMRSPPVRRDADRRAKRPTSGTTPTS
jgi:hypothetical protein